MEHFKGEQLYLSQRTGSYYVDMVKRPYTVVAVSDTHIMIQEAHCVFKEDKHYYDELPIDIVENKFGDIFILEKSRSKKYKDKFVLKKEPGDPYPYVATFGKYEYFPYLD